MSVCQATISWRNSGPDFRQNQYSRAHHWEFREGRVVEATAAPDIVPPPWSEPANVDPEQAFVASLASCHMLFFLSLAARNGHPVESYQDQAEGIMEKNAAGRGAITRFTLRPRINFGSDSIPDTQQVEDLHEAAHQRGFIANSVTTRITIESSHSSVGNG